MLKSVRERLTYANVMATAAVFLALGLGSAWAAGELGRDSVGARQIEKNAVKAAEIAKNAVRSGEVKNNALKGADVLETTLGQVPSAAHATTAASAAQATTATSAETVGGIPPSEIGGKGRSSAGGAGCNDDDENGQDCTSVALDLSRAQRVLVVANGEWSTPTFDDGGLGNSANLVQGRCRVFRAPGGEQIIEAQMGEARVAAGAAPIHAFVSTAGSFAMTAVTGSLASGSYTFTVNCIEDDGDIDFHRARISVVALGNG